MESEGSDFLFHKIIKGDLQQQKARDLVCIFGEIEKLFSLMLAH